MDSPILDQAVDIDTNDSDDWPPLASGILRR